MNELQEKIECVKATMSFEDKKLSPEIIELGQKILTGEITGDYAREIIAKKYNLKKYFFIYKKN